MATEEKPNVYNKHEMLEKLEQCGLQISFEALNSYIQELKIYAIFENEEGIELFDNPSFEKILDFAREKSVVEFTPETPQEYVKKSLLELAQESVQEFKVVSEPEPMAEPAPEPHDEPAPEQHDEPVQESVPEPKVELIEEFTQKLVNETEEKPAHDLIHEFAQKLTSELEPPTLEKTQEPLLEPEPTEQIEQPAIQSAQALSLPPQQVSNSFKLDISENTLNMVARAIAKKVTKNVTEALGAQGINSETEKKLTELEQNNTKLLDANSTLNSKLGEIENENQKLRLLLREANQNLNAYKPAAFGLYKFTGNKKAGRE